MAASPADLVIARAFGGVVTASDTACGAVSYDADGRRFVFLPAARDSARYALDIESVGGQMSDAVMQRLGAVTQAEAFKAWTVLEVQAKLLSVPVLALLRMSQRPQREMALVRCDSDAYWIAVGKLI